MENQKHIEAYQDLFNCLYSYGLILLQSEMDEIIDLSKKAVEKYNEASGLANAGTSEKDLRVCEASNRASKPHCWGKMTWILEYESGKEPPHYICSCEHGNRECLRLTRETALNKQNESTKI